MMGGTVLSKQRNDNKVQWYGKSTIASYDRSEIDPLLWSGSLIYIADLFLRILCNIDSCG